MKFSTVVLALILSGGVAFAQRHKPADIDVTKPDGKLLQNIEMESDEARKVVLMEQFVAQYPTHQGAAAIYEQMQTAYLKANNPDKALAAGEKLAAIDPADLIAAHQNLKAAEMKKDPALVKKWAIPTAQLAQKTAAAPQPKDEKEIEAWKANTGYAKQVKTYTEYTLFATALQSGDAKTKVDLLETLQKQNPKSEYVPQSAEQLFIAYQQMGATAKALSVAQRYANTEHANEDMLLVVAESALQNVEVARVHSSTARILKLIAAKPKPEGMTDAAWQSRKAIVAGLAHYLNGKMYYVENKFGPADDELRAALPLVQSNAALKPEVLFLLGVANYRIGRQSNTMGRILEAVKYSKECAAIKSPFQDLAQRNLSVIRLEYRGIQ